MKADVDAAWQSLRGATEAGCLPSANMNSEGTRKQVPTLCNPHLLLAGPFLAVLALGSRKDSLEMPETPHFPLRLRTNVPVTRSALRLTRNESYVSL